MIADMVFVDTNILVYTHDLSDPRKQRYATDLVSRLVSEDRAVISTQVLAECHNAFTRRIPMPLTLEEAAERLRNYSEALTVVPVTAEVVLMAADIACRYRTSYWDAQIVAAAKIDGLTVVLSEDMSAGTIIEGVQILNPFADGFSLDRLPA